MKKDKTRAWFHLLQVRFCGVVGNIAQCSSWGTSLPHKYASVINSFIFRAVQIVHSWNRKLGHTFYGLKTLQPVSKIWFVLPNFPGSHQWIFQQRSALPLVMNSWLCVTGLGRLRNLAEVRYQTPVLTGLCSHLQVHPTVVPQKEDVDLFTVCSFLFKPTQSPESSLWSIAPWAQWGAHQADTHTEQAGEQGLAKLYLGSCYSGYSTAPKGFCNVGFFSGSETIMIFLNSIFPYK